MAPTEAGLVNARWFHIVAPDCPPATVLVISGRIAGGAYGGWHRFDFRFGREWVQLRELLSSSGCTIEELPDVEPDPEEPEAVMAMVTP